MGNTLHRSNPIEKKPTETIKMGGMLSKSISSEEIAMALSKVKEIVSSNPVVVFSKTYCGYCNKVKQLFSQLNVSYKLIEMDVESDGGEMQTALTQWTGQRTVPNVFIGGKHIGGCDAVMALNKEGKLVPLLTEVGALAQASSERLVA